MKALLCPIGLILATLICYFSALDGKFVYDDEFLIQRNELLDRPELWSSFFRTSSTYGSGGEDSFYRPLQLLTYGIVNQIAGKDPYAFHWLNILLHILNALLLYYFLLQILAPHKHQSEIAFATALLWVVHPLHTEAIAYISGTADPLYVFLGLIALILSLRSGLAAYLIAIIFATLALLSKETAVTLGALIFASTLSVRLAQSSHLVSAKPLIRGALIRALPFVLIAGFYTALRGNLLNLDQSFQFYTEANLYTQSMFIRFMTAMSAVADYIKLLIWPHDLHIDRAYDMVSNFWNFKVIYGTLFTLLSVIGVFYFFKRQNWILFFSILWFWGAHFLHTGILLPLNSFFLEHWMYFPSVGLALPLIYLWFQIVRTRHWILAWVPILTLTAIFGWITFHQNQIWANTISLYSHILKFSPDVARVHNNLAMAYSDQGNLDEAELHYRKAIAIRDDYPQVRHNLGLIYMRKGQCPEALQEFAKAVQMKNNFYHSYPYMAECHHRLGEEEKAKSALQLYEQYRPKFN